MLIVHINGLLFYIEFKLWFSELDHKSAQIKHVDGFLQLKVLT